MLTCKQFHTNGSVAIVGAGPGGAILARLLNRRGYAVTVYERDESPTARPQGGSLDLRADSGQRAVDEAGLSEAFKRLSREDAKAFRMIDSSGTALPGMGQETHENPGPEIDRGDLRAMLLAALPADLVAWDHQVMAVEPAANGSWRLDFHGRDPATFDLVIGAEGTASKVRQRLTDVQPIYTGITMVAANMRRELWRGSEIDTILGEGSVMFAGLDKTIFVQRCAHDLILLYYSMAVPQGWPRTAGFAVDDAGAVMEAVRRAYRDWSPEIIEMLTQVQDRFHLWPTSVMPPDYRWQTQAGLTMLGDAAHVMPPFTGKGVNLALLDALELTQALTEDPDRDLTAAIAGYERKMQARTSEEIRACLQVGRQAYGIDLGFDIEAAA